MMDPWYNLGIGELLLILKNKMKDQFYLALIGVLFSGNIYFVKRTFDKLDDLQTVTWQVRQEVAVLKATQDQNQQTFNSKRK